MSKPFSWKQWDILGIAFVLGLGIFYIMTLSGCAGQQIKHARAQIRNDLQGIVQVQNCEATCWLLKEYIKTKLGQ